MKLYVDMYSSSILSFFPLQAAARQTTYEQSAVGKAAIKSVKAIQEEKKNPQGRPGGVDTRDWLT